MSLIYGSGFEKNSTTVKFDVENGFIFENSVGVKNGWRTSIEHELSTKNGEGAGLMEHLNDAVIRMLSVKHSSLSIIWWNTGQI